MRNFFRWITGATICVALIALGTCLGHWLYAFSVAGLMLP